MSRLAGLARTAIDKKDDSSSLTAHPSAPAQSHSNPHTSTAPSLSSLASGAQARPRQSLTGLGRLGSGAGNHSSNSVDNTGGASSSLSSLADARKEGHNRPSLQDLAKGSNVSLSSANATVLTGSRTGSLSSRPSLTLLARTQDRSQPMSPAGNTSTTTGFSSSYVTGRVPAQTNGSTPSLAQLAAGQTTAPRRSLTSLASASSSRAAAPSSAPLSSSVALSTEVTAAKISMGSTPRSAGRGLTGLGRVQRDPTLLRPATSSGSLTPEPSTTLSGLAQSSLQQRSSLSLADLSRQSPTGEIGLASNDISPAGRASATYTPVSSPVAALELDSEPQASASVTSTPSSHPQQTKSELLLREGSDVQEISQTDPFIHQDQEPEVDNTPAFTSLIAPPSHFAVSIFEKLDPIPSPIAIKTTSILEASTALFSSLGNSNIDSSYSLGGGTLALPFTSTGVVTPARVFRFDVPSPDDIVFNAQGQRPMVAART